MRILFSFLIIISSIYVNAQNRAQVLQDIDTLCSADFAGRGYVNDGDEKAADYIAARFEKLGLKHFGKDYFQSLSFPVNTFPGVVELKLGKYNKIPGVEFLVHPGCPSIKGTFTIVNIENEDLTDKKVYKALLKRIKKLEKWALIYNPKSYEKGASKTAYEKLRKKVTPNLEIQLTEGELVWWVSTKQEAIPIIILTKDVFDENATELDIEIEAKLFRHKSQNVIGYIEGTKYPDSFIVITAHYDHLGMMGSETIFPGANDNASGTAMMMDFAEFYSRNAPDYSICFIGFCGEEIGLLGSYYYTEHPLFPLKQISFLINMDLMGSGEDGIMAVNGKVFTEEWSLLDSLNTEYKLLTKVAARPKAANSDHYYFTEKGVKAFFFYLMGPYSNYHDVVDMPEALPLALYNESFMLIREFVTALQHRY